MEPPTKSADESPTVVVVGDLALDVIIRPHGAIARGTDTPSAVVTAAGGAGANTAFWLAGLGVSAVLLARVGHDAVAAGARDSLERAGVRCQLTVDPDRPTGVVPVLLGAAGERSMFPDRGANRALSIEDVDLRRLGVDGPAHLHLSAYTLFDPDSRPAGLQALRNARELGWTTSVDPQAESLIRREGPATVLGWFAGVDLLLPNASEVEALGGPDAILKVVPAIAATDGPHGASWRTVEGVARVPAHPLAGECEPTGAGDAFNAGLLASWLLGGTPIRALEAGVQAGSRAAAGSGAQH